MKIRVGWVGAVLGIAAVGLAGVPKPKYGPEAMRLSLSHKYIQTHDAPDFWALMPYYLPQQNGASCSVASVAMLMNGVRVHDDLTADEELVTQPGLLKKVGDSAWTRDVSSGGHGVTLDELGKFVEESLKAYGVRKYEVEVVHASDFSEKTKSRLHRALVENERSSKDFILINFIQGVYTGDADVGHIAPIGAYDQAHHRVLVLDPDREWYEPYWVSEETLLKGMATQDRQAVQARGYVWVKILKR